MAQPHAIEDRLEQTEGIHLELPRAAVLDAEAVVTEQSLECCALELEDVPGEIQVEPVLAPETSLGRAVVGYRDHQRSVFLEC